MAFASASPDLGKELDPGKCNALHIHLIEYACEELWALADDSEDESAEQYDAQAELLMTCAEMPPNPLLMTWLRERLPTPVFDLVCEEARRVDWPYLQTASPACLTPAAAEPMRLHQHWQQLQEVIKDGCKLLQHGGKLRRLSAENKRECDAQATALIAAVGEMGHNDALLEIGCRLRTPLAEVVREWEFEIDWQKEWGGRDERRSKAASSGASSSSGAGDF